MKSFSRMINKLILVREIDFADLRLGQMLATFQRNILQHCCMMLRQVLDALAKRTQHCRCLCAPCPWRSTSGPSACPKILANASLNFSYKIKMYRTCFVYNKAFRIFSKILRDRRNKLVSFITCKQCSTFQQKGYLMLRW